MSRAWRRCIRAYREECQRYASHVPKHSRRSPVPRNYRLHSPANGSSRRVATKARCAAIANRPDQRATHAEERCCAIGALDVQVHVLLLWPTAKPVKTRQLRPIAFQLRCPVGRRSGPSRLQDPRLPTCNPCSAMEQIFAKICKFPNKNCI